MEQFTDEKEDRRMRRRLRIRRWAVLAVAILALAFASSASARLAEGDGFSGNGGSSVVLYPAPPTVSEPSSGFGWTDAAIGAGIALGAAVGGVGIMRMAGQRRLAGLAQ